MEYLFPFIFYVGFAGIVAQLILELVRPLHRLRKPVLALWLTGLTLLWLVLPHQGRWTLSIWLPATVLGGQVLLDLTPALWWCGVIITAVLSGTAWCGVVTRRKPLPLSGALVLISLLTLWVSLTSGSLLTTLAAWAIFDLLWGVASLMLGEDGERSTFGLAIHGISSIVLWGSFLLLRQQGNSALWWLMWPTNPVQTLFTVAALMRLGFYPFQIVLPRRVNTVDTLSLICLLGVVPGVSLLYRILSLPESNALSDIVVLWGVLSTVWIGIMAWWYRGSQAVLWSAHAFFAAMVTGAVALGAAPLLVLGTSVWFACCALFVLTRGYDKRAFVWIWPSLLAVLFLLGVPPSPAGLLYSAVLTTVPWIWKLGFMLGIAIAGAALLRASITPPGGRSVFPWPWLSVGALLGLTMVILTLVLTTGIAGRWGAALLFQDGEPGFGWADTTVLSLGLWMLAMLIIAGLVRWQKAVQQGVRVLEPILDLVDLQWFYRSMWRGAEHLLGILRVSAEVLEGSGAVLWSLLVMMLILLVSVRR